MKRSLFMLLWFYSLVSFAQVIENPVFDRTNVPSMHIDKVEITTDTTFVYCTYSVEPNGWANISGETYILSYPSKIKHRLLSCIGLPLAPSKRTFPMGGKYEIVFTFPSIKGSSRFDFIESQDDKAFNIFGISMSDSNDSALKDFYIEQAMALLSKADFYAAIDNYEKAVEFEEQALPIIKYWYGKQSLQYEITIFGLGINYGMLKRYEEAHKYLKESLEISSLLYQEEDINYITKLETLATNCINLGDIMEAIRLYEKCVSIERKMSQRNDSQFVGTLILLAQAYQQIDDLTKALQYTEEAYSIIEKTGTIDEQLLYTLVNLTYLYSFANKEEKAKETVSKAYTLTKQYYGTENELYINVLSAMSQCALVSNDVDKALIYAQEMKEIAGRIYGTQSPQYGFSLNLLSQIYSIGLHNYKQAIQYELESLDAMKSVMTDFSYADRLGHLADDYAKIGDYKNALHYTNTSIDIIKRFSIDFEGATIDQKYTIWAKMNRNVISKYPLYVANSKDTNEIGHLYDNILFFKGFTSKSFDCNCTWRNIQESLNEDEIAIEFVESLERDTIFCYYALTLKKGYDSPRMFRLHDLSQFGDVLQDPLSFWEKNKELGDYIWGPIKTELENVNNVYFSPVGIFQFIGIENLPYNELLYYSDKYNMFRMSSTRELSKKRVPSNYMKAILYGGLDYNNCSMVSPSNNESIDRSGFDYLDNTDEEVVSISNTLREHGIESTIYNGEDGTEKEFRNLSGQDFDILHMATHGMSIKAENVEKMKINNNYNFLAHNSLDKLDYATDLLSWSFLVLSGGNSHVNRNLKIRNDNDGILTALEVANMDFRHLDLVVLSACESGLGSQGTDNLLFGLQHGFKDAGAKSILMSLSKVDDEATKLLMIEFYKNLMNGYSKVQSLKNAQNFLRKYNNGKYDSVGIWGAFVMLDGLN